MELDEIGAEMSALFKAFLPPELASRFSYLLALKPERWQKIEPWRVWEHIGTRSLSEWQGSAREILSSAAFSRHALEQVAVLRCGHDRPLLQRMPLQDAMLGKAAVFEGFVSVVSGRLGLAMNHDGMLCVLSR